MQPLLQIKDLSIDFVAGKEITQAVKAVSFTVNRGEVVAIVGESGSGKSVTALSILQLLPSPPAIYSTGEIIFSEDGGTSLNLLQLKNKYLQNIRGHKIAMIFQEPMSSLNPVMKCGDQVQESIRLHKNISRTEAKRITVEWFARVKLPNPAAIFNRYPHQLSGGQKQRLMIAMAMCCNPSLLICDEPTTALDVTVQKTILELIKELQREENMGVIFITHDLGVVAEVADRALVMYKGRIVEQNTLKELFTNPGHPYTKGLLACRPLLHPRGERLPVVSDFMNGEDMDIKDRESRIGESTSLAGDPEYKSLVLKNAPQFTEPILQVRNLNVWFPSKKNWLGKPVEFIKAVDDVSFTVFKGETLGLVGESGCGKTTLGRALLRLVEPTSGRIIYNGMDLTSANIGPKSLRKDIQIIFQDPYSSLNPRLTIGSAIAEPMSVHHLIKGERQRKDKVIELLEKVSLKPEHFNRYPHEFSGGQRQRIVIARALSLNPSFIVCDESVSALDVSVQAQVLNLLNDLKKEFDFTVIFISHDLSVVRYISNRIMVMNKGKIEESGDADEIYFHPQSLYTRNLIASIPKGMG